MLAIFLTIIHFFQPAPDSVRSFEQRLTMVRELAMQGDFPDAITRVHQIIEDARGTDLQDTLGLAYIRLGSTLCMSNQCNLAITHYRRALQLGTASNNQKVISSALLGLGAAYQTLSVEDSALFYYDRSVPVLAAIGDTTNLAGIFSNLGLIYGKRGEYELAQASFESALELQEQMQDWWHLARSYYNLGFTNLQARQEALAIDYFNRCIEISEANGLTGDKERSMRLLSLTYYELGDFEASAQHFVRLDSQKHEIFHMDDKNKILELETKYKTAEVERDNALKQTEINAVYFASSIVFLIGIGLYFFNEQRQKHTKLIMLRKEEENVKRITELLRDQEVKITDAILQGQEKQRDIVASELHDNLGNILVTLGMYADAFATTEEVNKKEDIARSMGEMAKQASAEVRKISHSLDSGLLEHFGLSAAITQLMEAVEMSSEVEVSCRLQLKDQWINETGLHVYRILQELVNNSLKHANCSKIDVELEQIEEHLSLIYHDNGRGFDRDGLSPGLGLKNIYSRVERLGGSLELETAPGAGTTFNIHLELNHVS